MAEIINLESLQHVVSLSATLIMKQPVETSWEHRFYRAIVGCIYMSLPFSSNFWQITFFFPIVLQCFYVSGSAPSKVDCSGGIAVWFLHYKEWCVSNFFFLMRKAFCEYQINQGNSTYNANYPIQTSQLSYLHFFKKLKLQCFEIGKAAWVRKVCNVAF